MNALKYLIVALQYLPHVLAGVQAVEAVVGAGNGATKKQLILSSLTAVARVGAQVPEDHVQVVSALVDSVVNTLNQSGLFSHRTTATPPVPVQVAAAVAVVTEA